MNIMRNHITALLCILVFHIPLAYGEFLCRPYEVVEDNFSGLNKFKNGLLWKISRNDKVSGYVYGTIHIGDSEVLNLHESVMQSLMASNNFLMEVVPQPEDVIEMSTTMFFMDGNKLGNIVNQDIFDKTTIILGNYGFTREMVSVMQPWAAYIVMSYPKNPGEILDFKLMEIAQSNGAQVFGLESAMEQVKIFSDLSLDEQARILTDAVCHYENTTEDFNEVKNHYLNRDLDSLYSFSKKYTFGDDAVYEAISLKLITQRNSKMVDQILDYLRDGITFIAVGAMHLPGEDGILNQLELRAYDIEKIY